MPISAQRTIVPEQTRNFGHFSDAAAEVPPLCNIQLESYKRFLQLDTPPEERTPTGLEGVLREIFPIESYDKTLSLNFLKYELGKPRYGPDECRQLRLTYGRPFRVWLRLVKDQPVEEEVKLDAAHRERLTGVQIVGDIIDPETGEVYLESGEALTPEKLDVLMASSVKDVTILSKVKDPLILNSLKEDPTSTHEEALLKIY